MSFSGLLTQTAKFYRRTSAKNKYNRETLSLGVSAFEEVPCYITEIGASKRNFGKEMVEYTHLVYTDYIESVKSSDFIIEIDSLQYEIIEVMDTMNNHHLEFGVNVLEDK